MAKLINLQHIAIDLDNTILKMDWSRWAKEGMEYFGDPKPGAIKALTRLRAAGWVIVIYTCRVMPVLSGYVYTPVELAEKVGKALTERGVPYDEIWIGRGKPITPFYIDDRAIEFKDNWEEIVERVLSSEEFGKESKEAKDVSELENVNRDNKELSANQNHGGVFGGSEK